MLLETLSAWVRVEDRGYKTPCHVWQRGTNDTGYPYARIDGRVQRVIRVLYELEHGPQPGMDVDHLCRVRRCVRVDHCEAIPHVENIQRGSTARLSVATVHEIRRRAAAGEKVMELARAIGVSHGTVSKVIRRRIWANV